MDAESVAFVESVENTLRVNTIRVAIKDNSVDGVPVVIRRLEAGDPVPPGTMEAMLVLTGGMTGYKGGSTRPSFDSRAFDAWIRRCSVMIHLHGRRVLRRLGYRI
jgi:hypothetical protein